MKMIKIIVITSLFLSVHALGDNLGKKDLDKIFESYTTNSEGKLKKSIKFLRDYSKKNFSIEGKVSGYYNDISNNYSVLWVRINDNTRVGCLANAKDKKFDYFSVKDVVVINGRISHLNFKYGNDLILARGCSLSKK